MQLKAFMRWAVVFPLTGLASLAWIVMLASWIGAGKAAPSVNEDKTLRQTLTQLPPEPPKAPEKEELPEPKPKPVAPAKDEISEARPVSDASAKEELAAAKPKAGAPAKEAMKGSPRRPQGGGAARAEQAALPASEEEAQAVTLSGARKDLERQGLAYLARGKMEGLPPIEGDSRSIESYTEFGKLCGFRFVVFDQATQKYIGELRLGTRPKIIPLDTETWGGQFSSKGRVIEHPTLTAMAQEAAQGRGEGEISLYAFTPVTFDAYIAGKCLAVLQRSGLDRKDVIAFAVRFEVRGARAIAVFTGARLASGKVMPINDTEG